jgi:Mn2+/Fe2+ NRAMP family transporter
MVIVYLASREAIMKDWKNSKLQSFLGWLITGIMTVASVATIWFLIIASSL